MLLYPSDISRTQYELIREDLEGFRRCTRKRRTDLYEVFCGVLYILSSGCQWRMLPREYPKWQTCYYYYNAWREKKDDNSPSFLDGLLKKIGCKASQG